VAFGNGVGVAIRQNEDDTHIPEQVTLGPKFQQLLPAGGPYNAQSGYTDGGSQMVDQMIQ
jgi:hypothetical protein